MSTVFLSNFYRFISFFIFILPFFYIFIYYSIHISICTRAFSQKYASLHKVSLHSQQRLQHDLHSDQDQDDTACKFCL